jgi:DNA-binding transcriptional MerR regulator
MAPATRTRGLLQIGDVAERTGLSLRSVRHYEEVGLLTPAERSPGGFRLYTEAAVERLLVIKQMKPLEFTLEQMRELLDAVDELAARPSASRRRALRETLFAHQAEVEQRIGKLEERLAGARALRASLEELLGDA